MESAGSQEFAVGALDDKQHRRLASRPDLVGKLLQMPCGARADRVREVGAAIGIHQVAVLDFHQVLGGSALEEEVDPGVGAIADLAAQAAEPPEPRYLSRADQCLAEAVGNHGVRPNVVPANKEKLEGVQQFALRALRRARHPRFCPRHDHSLHASRVNTMRFDDLAAAQLHRGDEAVIARQQAAFDEGSFVGNEQASTSRGAMANEFSTGDPCPPGP